MPGFPHTKVVLLLEENGLLTQQHADFQNLPDDKGISSPAVLPKHLMYIFSSTKVYLVVILGIRWCDFFYLWIPKKGKWTKSQAGFQLKH